MRHGLGHAIRLVWAAAVALVLAGCSSSKQPERASLEFWCYMGGGASDPTARFWNAVAARFEKANPNVKVKVTADIPHEYYMSMLGTRFIGRNAPDVMLMDDVEVGDLAREALLMPLERFIRSDRGYRGRDFAPSMVRDSYVNGIRYSIPWYGSFVQLTYRTDLFAQAGVTPPRTWDELLATCRTIQQRLGMQYPFGMDLSASFWMINWIWQNGGDVLSADSKRVTLDSPECIGAVQFVHDLVHKHGVVDPGLASGTKMPDLWSLGKIAMMLDGAFSIGRYDQQFPQWRGKWEVAPLPAGRKDISFYGGAHLVMSRRTRHPALAWRFMAFATSVQNQLRYADMLGSPPANLAVFELPEFQKRHPHLVRMRRVIAHGRNNPLVPFFGKIWYEMFANEVLDVVMHDPHADVAATLRAANRDAQRAADDYWATHPKFASEGAGE